jgi:hypothetical protein
MKIHVQKIGMFILLSGFFAAKSYGQATGVAINTSGADPHTSALLDVSASDKGVLVPRMTQIQRDAITSPASGLLIYQTDNGPGFYFYSGTAWTKIVSGVEATYTAGTGIGISSNTITNSAPDQPVTLTAGTGISVSGTYPSFTVTNSSPSSGGTVTSIATGDGITGGTITSSGTLGLTGQALALHNLSTDGIITRTGSGTVAARSIGVSGTGLSVTNGDGVSGNPTVASNATNANTASTIVARDASGNFSAGTITAALSGNATTATTLQNARNINGTSFNGSANITTANWGTARTLTLGSTGKSVDGSANVSWTLAEIGAAEALGSSNYIQNQTTTDQTAGFRINGNGLVGGNIGIATTSPLWRLDVQQGTMGNVNYNGNAGLNLWMANGSQAVPTDATADGTTIANINFGYRIGGNFSNFARIRSSIDGTASSAVDAPANLTFWTTADGSGTVTERMRISANGKVTISDLSTGGIVKSSATGLLSASALTAAEIPELDAAKITTGLIPTARGGTNSSATPTQGGVAYGTGSAYAFSSAGTSGQLLQSNGTSAPTWMGQASANTASTIVARDASGNFSAGTITAALSGNATTASTLQTARTINGTSFNGSANITITANTPNTLTRGAFLMGSNFNGSTATTWDVNATSVNTASAIVARDASGGFSSGNIDIYNPGNSGYAGYITLRNGATGSTVSDGAIIGMDGNVLRITNYETDNIEFATNNSVRWRITSLGHLRPSADNTFSIGSSALRVLDVWSANGTLQTSDIRFKENIEELNYGLDELLNVDPISFRWKDSQDTSVHLGFSAQQLKNVLPEVVAEGDDEIKRLSVNYSELIPVLVKAIQEQQVQIEKQQSQIHELKALISENPEIGKEYDVLKAELKELRNFLYSKSEK